MTHIRTTSRMVMAIAMTITLTACGGVANNEHPIAIDNSEHDAYSQKNETTPSEPDECGAWAGTYRLSNSEATIRLAGDCTLTATDGAEYRMQSLLKNSAPNGNGKNDEYVQGSQLLTLDDTRQGAVNIWGIFPKDVPMGFTNERMSDMATDRIISLSGSPYLGTPYEIVRANMFFREFIPE